MKILCTFELEVSDARIAQLRERFGNERAVRDVVKGAYVNKVLNGIPDAGDAITIHALNLEAPLPENVIVFPAHRVKTKAALQPVQPV